MNYEIKQLQKNNHDIYAHVSRRIIQELAYRIQIEKLNINQHTFCFMKKLICVHTHIHTQTHTHRPVVLHIYSETEPLYLIGMYLRIEEEKL